jgi:geranylgeranyl diphosphate synthase, type I
VLEPIQSMVRTDMNLRRRADSSRSLQVVPRTGRHGLERCVALEQAEALMVELAAPGDDVLGDIAAAHLRTGGKRLRARLALATLEALGGDRSAGAAWAAACELLHNATLIHDDVQDGDRTRRGEPTVWATHGAAQAINAGDLLLMLPYLALERLDVADGTRWRLARTLAHCASAVARGQAAELALDRTADHTWSGYRAVIAGKTGALFRLPAEGAALLVGRGEETARAIGVEFERLGVVFQLQDDVLDLYAEKGRHEPGSDLREGKVTALIIEHMARRPADRPWLRAVLAEPRSQTTEAAVRRAILRIRESGAMSAVIARIEAEADAVRTSRVLAAEPAIRALAMDLLTEIMKPIAHLAGETTPGSDDDETLCEAVAR